MGKQQYAGIIITQRHSPKRFTKILQCGVATNHINVLKTLVDVATARISGIYKGAVYFMEWSKGMELLRYCINHGVNRMVVM